MAFENDSVIIGVRWFAGVVGIVKVDVPYEGIKYYIGVGSGYNEECDTKYIADYGNTFPKEVGDLLFLKY